MRVIFSIVLLFTLYSVCSKKIYKTIKLKDFPREGPFIFLTKMVLGAGYAQVDITYYKQSEISSSSFYDSVAIGMVNQTEYHRFTLGYNCLEKEMRFMRSQKFNLKQERHGMKHFKIYDLQKQEKWYFYLFTCRANLEELVNNNQEIRLEVGVLNNGSHFQANDNMLVLYLVLFGVWLAMVIKFAMPMANILSLKNPNSVKIMVYGGMVILGTAYLYRVMHLLLFWTDGSGVHLFEVFYLVLKNIGEGVITTMLVAIAWGWTIVHLKPNQYYIILGVVSCLINIVSLILSSLTEQHQNLYHIYDTVPGLIVLILKSVLLLIFLLGIVNSLKESSGKIITFIKKLGWTGGSYLVSWPLTVLIVQFCFSEEQHRNVITFVEELVHICACTLLCHMISDQQSAYRKVSLHEDDNPLGMGSYKTR